ncbi:MAG TPA: redoxin domain-containing protein, partial [Candidatus Xenobia bacterium]
VVLIAVVGALLAVLLYNFTAVAGWMRGPDAYRLAAETKAPDFTWGSPSHTLPDTLGPKGLVLLFVSSTCPCSNAYTDRLMGLMTRFQAQGLPFLWINEDKIKLLDQHPSVPLQVALHQMEKYGVHVTTVQDTHDRIALRYGIKVTPEAVVLDHEGYIRYHGRVDDSQDPARVSSHELQDAMEALVAGRAIAVQETKAVGCFIVDDH